jgi:hypothetical protein
MNSKNIISSADALEILKNRQIAATSLELNSMHSSPSPHWASVPVRIISADDLQITVQEITTGDTGKHSLYSAEFSRVPLVNHRSGLVLKLKDGNQFTLTSELLE